MTTEERRATKRERSVFEAALIKAKRRYRLVGYTVIGGAFLFFAALVAIHHDYLTTQAKLRLQKHADVISASLWDLDQRAQLEYLLQVAETYHYEELKVVSANGEVFMEVAAPMPSPLDNAMLAAGLIRRVPLSTRVVYEGQPIGTIFVLWHNKIVYPCIYSLMVIVLMTVVVLLYLRTLHAKQTMEERVKLRTLELQESEERFRQLGEASWEAIGIYYRGVLLQANDMFFEMFGYGPEELLGKDVIAKLISPAWLERAWEMIAEKGVGPYEIEGRRKDGTLFPMEARVRYMERSGHVVQVAAIRDLTNRKRMESMLAQSQKMEAIGTLAGGIAHDFNNILSAILGYSELALLELPETSDSKGYIDQVLRAGNRAKELVKQILTFARKDKEEKVPVQVSLIVKEALKLLRASLPTSIEIREVLRSDAKVLSDTTQIHQIMMNLCTNAGKSMPTGGVMAVALNEATPDSELMLEHGLDAPAARYLCLTVKDTGEGMGKDVQARIFDPFYTNHDMTGGTGMGLAVVHGIVSDCKGLIEVESEPGKGSTFRVYMPIIGDSQSKATTQSDALEGGTERVMFVDDEEPIVKVGQEMLTRLGYSVEGFTSSVAAAAAFSEAPESFDLVITDMTMPEMSGEELVARILSIRPGMPVILCTGYSEGVSPEDSARLGVSSLIMKPVVATVLSKTIRKALDSSNN